MAKTEQLENDMIDTKTRNQITVINAALKEHETKSQTPSLLCSPAEYVDKALKEHGLPPLGGRGLDVEASRARDSAIVQAYKEFEDHADVIACSRREYIDEHLRAIGQSVITDEEQGAHGLGPLVATRTRMMPNRARTDAIQESCSEFATHEKLIPCSRREFINETLREIGQSVISDDEHRELDIRG